MLDEELWVYMDLSFKAHDPYSLISLLNLEQPRTRVFLRQRLSTRHLKHP
jgi:hypothetical protein